MLPNPAAEMPAEAWTQETSTPDEFVDACLHPTSQTSACTRVRADLGTGMYVNVFGESHVAFLLSGNFHFPFHSYKGNCRVTPRTPNVYPVPIASSIWLEGTVEIAVPNLPFQTKLHGQTHRVNDWILNRGFAEYEPKDYVFNSHLVGYCWDSDPGCCCKICSQWMPCSLSECRYDLELAVYLHKDPIATFGLETVARLLDGDWRTRFMYFAPNDLCVKELKENVILTLTCF